MSLLLAAAGDTTFLIVFYVVIIAAFYFFLIRPRRKEQNRINQMYADMEVGDSVLTTSGFYGVLIDIEEETVIVEFGGNKNCLFRCRKQRFSRSRSLQLVRKSNSLYKRQL